MLKTNYEKKKENNNQVIAGNVLLIQLKYSVLKDFFISDVAENNNTCNRTFSILKAKNRKSII